MVIRTVHLGVALLLASLLGCRADRIERPNESDMPGGLPPGMQLLLTPVGDPDGLLGRMVEQDASGAWVVADARAPGCEVKINRVPTSFIRKYLEDAGKVASLSVGSERLAALSAKYSKGLRKYAEIVNVEQLEADLRGTCGDHVITSVMVGTGRSELEYLEEAQGGAWVAVGKVPVGAAGGKTDRVEGSIEWAEPQAWAFMVGAPNTGASVDLVVHMPAVLAAGTTFSAEIEVKRSVWLVVLYEAADGSAGVLVPSPGAPMQQAIAGERVALPSFDAMAADGQAKTHERLVVYGFLEQGDFEQFRPPAGAISPAQARAYATELPAKLEGIPRRRWISTDFGYVIEAPAAPGPTRKKAGG